MTEIRPETEAAAGLAAPATTLDSVLGTGDHKVIGRLWIGTGALFLLAALAISAVAAVETLDLGGFSIVEDAGEFVQIYSLAREALFFAGIVPLLVGLATYLTPLQVGSSALAFSRGAAAAFWCWLASTIIFIVAYIDNGGPAGGRLDGTVLWTLSLAAMIGSIVWALVCVATTTLGARAPGMSLDRVPVSAWGFTVFSVVGLFALPIVMAQLLLAYIDTKYGYLPTSADRLSLVTIGNSFSLAPALYWVSVPALGLAIDMIAVHSGRPVRFHRSVLAALGLLGIASFASELLSFGGRGRPVAFDNGLLVVGLLVAILPTLAALALVGDSIKSGGVKVTAPMTAALLAGLLTLLGVVVGALGTIAPIVGFVEKVADTDINLSSALTLNTTAFHDGVRGLILGAAVVAIIGAVHHWGHKIFGRNLSEPAGLAAVLASALGAVLWGIGGVINGFLEAPLFMIDADVDGNVETLNLLAVVGTALLTAGAALLLLNVLGALAGRGTSTEPWRGTTLEWSTTSPPPPGNFAEMPIVNSATPLADAAQEDQA
ncbi:MAG: cbb3-type cytochrome c oxidase subunit I [Acidimicrobiales bacterium]